MASSPALLPKNDQERDQKSPVPPPVPPAAWSGCVAHRPRMSESSASQVDESGG